MKDALQAELDALKTELAKVQGEFEAKKAELEATIAAKESSLKSFIENIPAELHGIEVATWDRIKAWVKSL